MDAVEDLDHRSSERAPLSRIVEAPQDRAVSLLEQLRQGRRQAASERRAQITIPETGGILVATYRLLDPREELDPITERCRRTAKSDTELQLLVATDVLIAACEGIYVRDEDGTLLPVAADETGPARYDDRLANALSIDLSSAQSKPRAVVRGAFNGNEVAIFEHSQRLQRWMADTSKDVDRDLWGQT